LNLQTKQHCEMVSITWFTLNTA